MPDTPSTTAAVAGFSGMLNILTFFKAEPSLNPTYIGIYDGGNMVGGFRYSLLSRYQHIQISHKDIILTCVCFF